MACWKISDRSDLSAEDRLSHRELFPSWLPSLCGGVRAPCAAVPEVAEQQGSGRSWCGAGVLTEPGFDVAALRAQVSVVPVAEGC